MAGTGALRDLSPGLAGDGFRAMQGIGIELLLRGWLVMLIYQMMW